MSTQTVKAPSPMEFRTNDSPAKRVQLLGSNNSGIIVATIGVLIAASIFADGFLSSANLLSVIQQISLLGIVATGMTYIIVSGEMDLSVGSQYGFLAVALAWMVSDIGIPVGTAAPLVIVLGGVIGALNGFITTKFGLPSFVVTLASLSILRGGALLLSDGVPVKGSVNETFRAIVAGQPFPDFTAQSFWMAGIMLVFGIVLATTKFGSDVYSVGGNSKAAADSGHQRCPGQGPLLRPHRFAVRTCRSDPCRWLKTRIH